MSRSQNPKSVMVWAGVAFGAKTPLIFIDRGVKINQVVYREMLENKVLPWAQENLREGWVFQQDSAPAHKARGTQQWINAHFPDFISPQQWPPHSPDLNPLDYSVWAILERKACSKPHESLESLKEALQKAWEEIPLELVNNIVDNFPTRLKLCVDSRGDHFE